MTQTPTLSLGCELQNARVCVLSLHGRFGSAHDGIALGAPLLEALLGRAWADIACVVAPTAANNKWYPHSFLFPREKNEPQTTASLASVQALATSLRQQLPLSSALVLIGFSQGACLTTEIIAAHARTGADRSTVPYAAAIAFTGGLMGDESERASRRLPTTTPTLAGFPLALLTGDPDSHVPVERVQETAVTFRAAGADVWLQVNKGKRHVVLPEELQQTGGWLAGKLGLFR